MTPDCNFIDELESIIITISLFLGDVVAANADLKVKDRNMQQWHNIYVPWEILGNSVISTGIYICWASCSQLDWTHVQQLV